MKTSTNNKRIAGVELLRIIAMLMIIAHHWAIHTPWNSISEIPAPNDYYIKIMASFGKIGVAIFFMITGYFIMTQTHFKPKRILNILIPTWFYPLIIPLVAIALGAQIAQLQRPLLTIVSSSLFPILKNRYWFITQYIVIYLLSPILKKGLSSLRNNELAWLLIIMITFGPISRILNIFTGINDTGIFVIPEGLFYFIIGYGAFRFKDIIKTKYAIALALITTNILLFGPIIISFISNLTKQHSIPNNLLWDTESFTTLILSTSLLIIATRIRLKSSVILRVAKLTLGVYLIHDNIYMRQILWGPHGIASSLNYATQPLSTFIFNGTLMVVMVFFVCATIEYLRQSATRKISQILVTVKHRRSKSHYN